MILTDRFVYLAFPRTGTTFVRNALKRLYGVREDGLLRRLGIGRGRARGSLRERIVPMTHSTSARTEGRASQHGGVSLIPEDARRLPVFATMRNPYDLIVSSYEHGFWRDHPIADVHDLRRKYPGYPDLTFEQYVAMMHDDGVRDLLQGSPLRADVGHLTLRFLDFFCRVPERIPSWLTDAWVDRGDVVEKLGSVRFVYTENLVPELRAFLSTVGIEERRTRFMERLPKTNAAVKRRERPWQEYYTASLRRLVRNKERLLFRVFRHYDS